MRIHTSGKFLWLYRVLPGVDSSALLTVAALLGVLSTGCKDSFRCGIPSNGVSATCNGSNETCICDTHRCALPEVDCPSGLRYRSANGWGTECVDSVNLPRQVTGSNLCPDQANREIQCGQPGGATCPAGSSCLCSVQRCVALSSSCKSGLLWQSTQVCAEGLTVLDFERSRAGKDGLCPAKEDCGVPGSDGNALGCESGQQCSCQARRCVSPAPIERCATGYAWADDRVCLGQPAAGDCRQSWPDGTCISEPYAASIEQTFLGGRALCTDARPVETHCGLRNEAGAVATCASGEQCICDGPTATPFRCAKSVQTQRCEGSLAFSYDGSCVDNLDGSQRRYFQAAANGVCPELAPKPDSECGIDAGGQPKACANAEDECFCPTKRCVFRVPAAECAGGYAYRSNGRCVERLVARSRCESGRAWPQDGSCVADPVARSVSQEVINNKAYCPGSAPMVDGGVKD